MKNFALIAVLLVMVACAGKDNHPGVIVPDNNGGSAGRAAHAGSGAGAASGASGASGSDSALSDAGEGGAPDESGLAPVVEITSPKAVSDPDKGDVLTDSEVTVTCTVTDSPLHGAQPVLGASIKIQMFGADGKQIGTDGSVMSTSNANEYSALFVLTKVPGGPVSFTCSASDKTAAYTGRSQVRTFYDVGPAISLAEPAPKSARSLGEVLFKFSALPTSLSPGDMGAVVDTVTLSVAGIPITDFTPVAGTPGYYQASVDLNNRVQFPAIPVGAVSVVITAKNKRGTTATSNSTFVVDSTGPLIKITSPPTANVQFVTGQVQLVFTVIDEPGGSGVNPDSVQVQVNTAAPVQFKEGSSWHAEGNMFYYTFSINDFVLNTQVGVEVDAYDLAGNKAHSASALYYLDVVPPTIDMDPPPLQEKTSAGLCSSSFDPLGDSPNDLQVIPATNYFRALLWDLGNYTDSNNGIVFFSDIDTNTGVRMYFQEDTSKPLLKGDVAGGICNQIADTTLPFVNLYAIAPTGNAYFPRDAAQGAGCLAGSDSIPPQLLCNGHSSLSRVIQHEVATTDAVAAVFGLQGDMGALCTGGQLDLTTKITKDGWVCAAVVAQDKLGNAAVSAPLRFCLDALAYPGKPACASANPPPAPTCFDVPPTGCTTPKRFTETLIKRPN